jgi:hypothetical protein
MSKWIYWSTLALLGCSGAVEETDTGEETSLREQFIHPSVEIAGDMACQPTDGTFLDEAQEIDPAKQVALSMVPGEVTDFETGNPVEDANVEIWYSDQVSGAADANATSGTVASGDAGMVAADLTACTPMTYRVSTDPARGDTKVTYEAHDFYVDPDGVAAAEFNSVSTTTYSLIPALLGISPDVDMSIIAGGAYDCNDDPIEGAMVVVVDDDGKVPESLLIKYFIEDFPSPDQPYTSADGLWVAMDVPEGNWTVELWGLVNGAETLLGKTALQAYAGSINISSIYTGYETGVKAPASCLATAQ